MCGFSSPCQWCTTARAFGRVGQGVHHSPALFTIGSRRHCPPVEKLLDDNLPTKQVFARNPAGRPILSGDKGRTKSTCAIVEVWLRVVVSSRPVMHYVKEAYDITRCSAIG